MTYFEFTVVGLGIVLRSTGCMVKQPVEILDENDEWQIYIKEGATFQLGGNTNVLQINDPGEYRIPVIDAPCCDTPASVISEDIVAENGGGSPALNFEYLALFNSADNPDISTYPPEIGGPLSDVPAIGTMEISNKSLRATSPGPGQAYLSAPSPGQWDDVEIRCGLSQVIEQDFIIGWRGDIDSANNPAGGNGYRLQYGLGVNRFDLLRVVGGVIDTTLAQHTGAVDTDKGVDIRIVLSGDSHQVYLNNILRLSGVSAPIYGDYFKFYSDWAALNYLWIYKP